jgi:hypothetical protein
VKWKNVVENTEEGGLTQGGIQVLDIQRGRWWIGKGLFQIARVKKAVIEWKWCWIILEAYLMLVAMLGLACWIHKAMQSGGVILKAGLDGEFEDVVVGGQHQGARVIDGLDRGLTAVPVNVLILKQSVAVAVQVAGIPE